MASGVTIEITGWDKIVAKYGKAAADTAVKAALVEAVNYTADLVRQRVAGQHHVTGFLASSISGDVTSSNSGKTFARQGGGVYYAPFVERGTGIYGPNGKPIVPKHAKRLAWHPKTTTGKPIKGQGKIVRRSVKGQKPVLMFHKTLTEDKSKIADRFTRSFKSKFSMK